MEVSDCGEKQANVNQLGNPKVVLSKVIRVRGLAVFASPCGLMESTTVELEGLGMGGRHPFPNHLLSSFFLQVY